MFIGEAASELRLDGLLGIVLNAVLLFSLSQLGGVPVDIADEVVHVRRDPERKNGGSAWESNPPTVLFARYLGFEVPEAHQVPIHSRAKLHSNP